MPIENHGGPGDLVKQKDMTKKILWVEKYFQLFFI